MNLPSAEACLAKLTVAAMLACTSAGASETGRVVDDGILVSQAEPRLAMSVDRSFSYAGRHPIRIDDIAAGERFVFLDTEGRAIRRLIVVQLEGFLPGVDETYRYKLDGRPVVAGYAWRSNAYAFDFFESARENPTKESAATRSFLEAQGYEAPQQWMMWRSLTVTDAARKQEAIIFYVEDVAATGLTLDDLYADGSATQDWIDIQGQLEARANGSFRLTGLKPDGSPDTGAWSSIPNTSMR